jgi:thioredoxin-like negative regulator of GroEL
MLAPGLEAIARDYAGRLLVAKVNTDENPEWATHYGVRGIPAMLLMNDGKVVRHQVSALPMPYLKQMVDQLVALEPKPAHGVAWPVRADDPYWGDGTGVRPIRMKADEMERPQCGNNGCRSWIAVSGTR